MSLILHQSQRAVASQVGSRPLGGSTSTALHGTAKTMPMCWSITAEFAVGAEFEPGSDTTKLHDQRPKGFPSG